MSCGRILNAGRNLMLSSTEWMEGWSVSNDSFQWKHTNTSLLAKAKILVGTWEEGTRRFLLAVNAKQHFYILLFFIAAKLKCQSFVK